MPCPRGSDLFDPNRLVQKTCFSDNHHQKTQYASPGLLLSHIYTFHLILEPQQRNGHFRDREMEDQGKNIKLFTHLILRSRSKFALPLYNFLFLINNNCIFIDAKCIASLLNLFSYI